MDHRGPRRAAAPPGSSYLRELRGRPMLHVNAIELSLGLARRSLIVKPAD